MARSQKSFTSVVGGLHPNEDDDVDNAGTEEEEEEEQEDNLQLRERGEECERHVFRSMSKTSQGL